MTSTSPTRRRPPWPARRRTSSSSPAAGWPRRRPCPWPCPPPTPAATAPPSTAGSLRAGGSGTACFRAPAPSPATTWSALMAASATTCSRTSPTHPPAASPSSASSCPSRRRSGPHSWQPLAGRARPSTTPPLALLAPWRPRRWRRGAGPRPPPSLGWTPNRFPRPPATWPRPRTGPRHTGTSLAPPGCATGTASRTTRALPTTGLSEAACRLAPSTTRPCSVPTALPRVTCSP
mmetsp:Transcript_208/g.611  ORF Transcript_208/g.611 Transcript_208/m.611 type:complete len:234 (-) Transcript_208:492-1193(-)